MAKAKRTAKKIAPKSSRTAGARKVTRKPKTMAKRAAAATTSTASKEQSHNPSGAAMQHNMMGMNFDPNMMQNWMTGGAAEAQKAQDKMMAISRESAEQLSKSADAASRSLNEAMSLSKENVEACMKSSNIASEVSKHVGEEIFNYANQSFAKNVELSKELLACRTLNDMFDLQSKFVKANMDSLFNESVKISELMFNGASKASQPISKCMTGSAERIKKTMAA